MSFAPGRLRPCAQALTSRRKVSRSLGLAECRLCRQLTTDSSRHHHHGLRRATGRGGNVGRFSRGRAEGNLLRSAGAARNYSPWSPSMGEDKASLNLPSAAEGAQHKRQQQQQQQQRQPPLPPSGNPMPRRKTAQAVAMDEFAALERKLASPRRKTPEEIAMEEFAALERKLGSSSGVSEQRGLRKARSPPLTRPEEPDSEECCGNGCATCVWIGYWEELQAWEEAEREREEAPP